MYGPVLGRKAQIALEFLIVYSFILVVFILMFSLVATQRATSITQQEYSLLQLQTESIASYIDQALVVGSGYYTVIPFPTGITNYNLSVSSTGVVIAQEKQGSQPISSYAFSNGRNFVINGTLVVSGNGIQVYQIQTARGSISIANEGGTIYIDQIPTATASGFQNPFVTQVADVKAAVFNDISPSKTEIIVPNSNSLTVQNGFSVSFWFESNPARVTCGSIIGKSTTGQSGQFGILVGPSCTAGRRTSSLLNFSYKNTVGASEYLLSNSFPTGSWVYAVAVFNGVSGSFNWYLNGSLTNQYSGQSISADTSNLIIGGGSAPFNGSIADVQVYNSTLSANQIATLYNYGIGGGAVNANLTGWWPLNGNTRDYSGYGNGGYSPNGIGYQTVSETNVKFLLNNGAPVGTRVLGVVAQNGLVGLNGSSADFYTNSSGTNIFVYSNSSYGLDPVSVDLLLQKGNALAANLVAWWPLDTGFGNVAYDLQRFDNGQINGAKWLGTQTRLSEPFITANFPGDLTGVSGSATKDGFITVSSSESLFNLVENHSFTLVSWVYYKGPTPSHEQGIFGDWPGNGQGGFQLEGYNCGADCTSNAILIVNGSPVNFPSGVSNVPVNTWQMITAEYNGTTGLTTVYLNNSVFATNVLPAKLQLLQQGSYYIGDDASQPGGLDSFNGMISNIQLYSFYLNWQQINNLYQAGLTSAPLSNSGLISWWPLANNTADYSNNNNVGIINDNVTFVSGSYSQYLRNSTIGSQPNTGSFGADYPNFYGAGNVVIPYSGSSSISGSFTVSLWFIDSANTATYTYELLNTSSSGNDNLDIQLCGFEACGITGGIHSEVGNGGGSWLAPNMNYITTFSPDTWYNLIESFNSTGWSMYLNGAKVASGTTGAVPVLIGTGQKIYLAGGNDRANDMIGQMGNVQLYNKWFNPAQVAQIYSAGFATHYNYTTSLG